MLNNFCKVHEEGLVEYPPFLHEDFNGMYHPRRLESQKLQLGRLWRLYLNIGGCIL